MLIFILRTSNLWPMKIGWTPWKLNNLCRSQHGTFFFILGDKSPFPGDLEWHPGRVQAFRIGADKLNSALLFQDKLCPLILQLLTCSGGSVLHSPGWVEDGSILMPPILGNGCFPLSRKSPRGCSSEILSKDDAAAFRPPATHWARIGQKAGKAILSLSDTNSNHDESAASPRS